MPWYKTAVSEKLGLRYPIIQAGMAGGSTTPELVAAVSNAGGLGTLGAGYMTAQQIREALLRIRELTDRPFAVNLFIPEPYEVRSEDIAAMNEVLGTYRQKLGLPADPSPPDRYSEPFEEQLEVVLAEQVPAFSFTFGLPSGAVIERLQSCGIVTIGTATTVAEAVQLEQAGIELIVGQGSEAGGHRGTFAVPHEQALVGTMALIPQLADRVRVPVIAAGGIMDGRGVAAALALGASGVQMGTAFLTALESGAHPRYKEELMRSTDDSTTLTRAFSGKPARGIRNAFIADMERCEVRIPPYPVQNALTRDIRQAAARAGDAGGLSLWAGQAAALCRTEGAADIIRRTVQQTSERFGRFNA
ncbi:nitronate monooxygenase family protein [Paenibacillus sp. J2TS4]|uniref:NAD(P)H-dependent flavin oxidoreductase n=1 Tax=Paenibacillus sp. J2TS4 TaxID=2807194 RepID=UPI0024BE8771|nr:nitronate monooxygenase [Paenibacillus sp. J2TS4]